MYRILLYVCMYIIVCQSLRFTPQPQPSDSPAKHPQSPSQIHTEESHRGTGQSAWVDFKGTAWVGLLNCKRSVIQCHPLSLSFVPW